ncbi:MAG TPA: PQQ-binding-like beta-propeller repeat protein, partial [Polyangiaceae bacterium]
ESGFHAAAQAWRRLVKAGGVGVGLAATLGTSRLPPNTPVVTKDAVHVVHEERLYTLAAASGRVVRQVASAVRSVPEGSFVVGGVLCAATEGFALASGKLLWEHPRALETAFDGERLLLLRDQQFDVVDPVTGTLLRRHAGGRDLAIAESFALVRDRRGGLVLYDLAGGTARAVEPIAEPDAALAGNSGRFYFAEDERILVLDPRTLRVRSKNISGSISFPPAFLRGTKGALLAYVRNFWGRTTLVAMDPFELHELWAENDLRLSATTSRLVFSNVQTTLVATDARTGQRRWRQSIGGNSETLGVAATEELLVTQDHAGVVVGVDIQSGARRWRTELVRTE